MNAAFSVVVSNALGTVTSSNMWLTVIPEQAVIVTQSLLVSNCVVSFQALSPAGLKWALLGSSNLTDWLNLGVLTNTTGTMLFSAPDTSSIRLSLELSARQ